MPHYISYSGCRPPSFILLWVFCARLISQGMYAGIVGILPCTCTLSSHSTLTFFLHIRALIYIFYVIHYSNPVLPFSSKSGHSKHEWKHFMSLLDEAQKWMCLWFLPLNLYNSNLPNCRILTSITNSTEICFKCIWHKLCFHKVVQKPPSIQNFQLRLIKSLQKTAWKVKLFERKDGLQGGKIGQSKLILTSWPEFRLSQWGCIAFALDVIVWRKQ